MTRKQGNKKQTEAGGTGVVSSESSDSFPGMPGTLFCRSLVDRETQTPLLSSIYNVQYSPTSYHLSLVFSLKLKLLSLLSHINCIL